MLSEETLGVAEVAAILHADGETIMQYARRGELAGTRIGKSWVFMRDDVIAFLRKQIAVDTLERQRRQASANAVYVGVSVRSRRRTLPELPAAPTSQDPRSENS
jgi:excisionase family DNA binding protein